MARTVPVRICGAVAIVAWLVSAPVLRAQAPAASPLKSGPSNSSDLGLVVAAGNAESASVGLHNLFTYRWPDAEWRWETGWLRVTSHDGHRFAVGTASAFAIRQPDAGIGSERLFSKLRYERQVLNRTDWFASLDAARDVPANLLRQVVIAGGLGTTWQKTDRASLRTAYGFTYTDEELSVEGVHRFGGYRLYYGLKEPIASAAAVESELTADGSFNIADDIRLDWLNGVTVAINSNVALKSSIRLLFRNLPALETLDLRSPDGTIVGSVEASKAELDTNLTTSLVLTF